MLKFYEAKNIGIADALTRLFNEVDWKRLKLKMNIYFFIITMDNISTKKGLIRSKTT